MHCAVCGSEFGVGLLCWEFKSCGCPFSCGLRRWVIQDEHSVVKSNRIVMFSGAEIFIAFV